MNFPQWLNCRRWLVAFEVDGLLIALHRAIGSVNWSDEPLTMMTTASLKWRYQRRLWSKRYRFLRAICGFAFLTVFVFLERLAAVLLAPCLLRGGTAV